MEVAHHLLEQTTHCPDPSTGLEIPVTASSQFLLLFLLPTLSLLPPRSPPSSPSSSYPPCLFHSSPPLPRPPLFLPPPLHHPPPLLPPMHPPPTPPPLPPFSPLPPPPMSSFTESQLLWSDDGYCGGHGCLLGTSVRAGPVPVVGCLWSRGCNSSLTRQSLPLLLDKPVKPAIMKSQEGRFIQCGHIGRETKKFQALLSPAPFIFSVST